MLPKITHAWKINEEENDKMNCYLCKNNFDEDEIGYQSFDNSFILCFNCCGNDCHTIYCDDCEKDIDDYKDLKYLCDIYNYVNCCILCRLKKQNEYGGYDIDLHPEINKLKKKIIILEKEKEEHLVLINNLTEIIEETRNRGKRVDELFKDNYVNFMLAEDEEQKKIRIQNSLRKKIIRNKCLSVLKEDKSKFIELKKERDIKMEMFKEKIKKNTIKSKVLNSLRNLSENTNNIDKIIKTVKKYKDRLKFDDLELQKCALDNNKTKINFFSILYEKKEIKKSISDKDFKLAVEEYHSDKNITRITKISKTCYYLRNNNIIWNSDIIFKSLYIFQYLEDYQFNYLIKEIEKICI